MTSIGRPAATSSPIWGVMFKPAQKVGPLAVSARAATSSVASASRSACVKACSVLRAAGRARAKIWRTSQLSTVRALRLAPSSLTTRRPGSRLSTDTLEARGVGASERARFAIAAVRDARGAFATKIRSMTISSADEDVKAVQDAFDRRSASRRLRLGRRDMKGLERRVLSRQPLSCCPPRSALGLRGRRARQCRCEIRISTRAVRACACVAAAARSCLRSPRPRRRRWRPSRPGGDGRCSLDAAVDRSSSRSRSSPAPAA